MSRRSVALIVALLCIAVPATAGAEIVRDGKDAAGPLDLVKVKLGQHDLRLVARIETSRPLPRLRLLEAHPGLKRRRAERYLCLNVASPSIGRRLLCPAGGIRHGRLDVGVSVIGRHGPRRAGSSSAGVSRGKRQIELALNLRKLGLKPGRLTFSAQSSWYGPACRVPGDRRGRRTVCRDRAPRRGSGTTRIYPVRRVGCGGFSDHNVFNGPGNRKRVALTFDDGPSVYTPQILKILENHNAHATFFQTGSQVPVYSAYSRRVLAQGSELGNHSMRHAVGPGKGDIAQTNRVIENATGFRPCMFRPPEGVLPAATQAAVEALHMVSVRWSVETSDYTLPGAGTIYSRAVKVQPGSIVLMHDGGGPRGQTVAALPHIIENLKSRGYRLVTLTELLGGRYELAEVHRRGRVAQSRSASSRSNTTPALAR